MAIAIYKDEALTARVTQSTPKRFLLPLAGGSKISTLWLGDAYSATVSQPASSGASTLDLDQTSEFPDSGGALINGLAITYTGVTTSSLTGVSGLTAPAAVGDTIQPNIVWLSTGNVTLNPRGSDLSQVGVQLKAVADTSYNFLDSPLILDDTLVSIGSENAIAFNIQVSVIAGEQQEFIHWEVASSNFYRRQAGTLTVPTITEVGYAADMYGYVSRRDQALPQSLRLLPINRQVADDLPGFIVGQYRWRDQSTRNGDVLIPTRWDITAEEVGEEKYVAGIGDLDDLQPIGLEQAVDSILLRVNHGHYFTGSREYYLPSGRQLEFVAANSGALEHVLAARPRANRPIFVGTWLLDNRGFYEKETEYRQIGVLTNPNGSPRSDLPVYYFTWDQPANTITLSLGLTRRTVFLGTISGQPIDYFNLPVYPVDDVIRVYVDQGLGNPTIESTLFSWDRGLGTLQVAAPSGTGVSVPTALIGQPVFAMVEPAVAILYETGTSDSSLEVDVDVNPAFSGISNGFYYLQHRRQVPASIVLACDKPQIPVPATHDSIIGLVAFGPVYFEEDYALVLGTAFSEVPGETVPNAFLNVVVGSGWSGLINYQDPLSGLVQVRTGGDGVASMIYTPTPNIGQYIPPFVAAGGLAGLATTTLTNDTLILPTPVPISQVWNSKEGWLVTTYLVYNNDPLFGIVGGDPSQGEIPWLTTGIPGTADYRTNGERDPWRSGQVLIRPIDAKDATGHSYTAGGFTGDVAKLIYATSIPGAPDTTTAEVTAHVGAYFVTFLQRVTLQLQAINSDVISNTILLQMDVAPLLIENPWLVIDDDVQGFLNQNRLGFVRSNQQGPTH